MVPIVYKGYLCHIHHYKKIIRKPKTFNLKANKRIRGKGQCSGTGEVNAFVPICPRLNSKRLGVEIEIFGKTILESDF